MQHFRWGQGTLRYYNKKGSAVLSFSLCMLLLSPTDWSASSFSSSRDNSVPSPWQLVAGGWWLSSASLKHLRAVWYFCKKYKTEQNPKWQNTVCVCISLSEASFWPLLMSLQQQSRFPWQLILQLILLKISYNGRDVKKTVIYLQNCHSVHLMVLLVCLCLFSSENH